MYRPEEFRLLQTLMKETIQSLRQRAYYNVHDVDAITEWENKLQTEIDIVGDVSCTFRLIGDQALFSKLVKTIHSIELEGELLHSFIGEFWNMVLGPVLKSVKTKDNNVDISPSKPATPVDEESKKANYRRCFVVHDQENNRLGELAFYCLLPKGENK